LHELAHLIQVKVDQFTSFFNFLLYLDLSWREKHRENILSLLKILDKFWNHIHGLIEDSQAKASAAVHIPAKLF